MYELKLEEKIDLWKNSLREAGAFSEEQLYELEDHLQERLNDLLASGYSEKAAFTEATMDLGQPIELSAAYSFNNRPLILKQLLLYFLLGFPAIVFIFELFYFIWNLTGIALLEGGLRGFDYSVALTIPGSLLFLLLTWKTFRNPYWMIQVPRNLVRQSSFKLIAILIGISTILMGQHVFYTEWLFDNGMLRPQDYLVFDFSEPIFIFSFFSTIALKVIPLMLFFSICLDTLQGAKFSKNLWNKVCLTTMLVGFHAFTNLRRLANYFFFQPGNMKEMEIADQMISICSILILGTLGIFLMRQMNRKGKLISGT